MRRIVPGIAATLITFMLGSFTADVWNFIAEEPATEPVSYYFEPLVDPTTAKANYVAETEIRELYRQYDIAQTRHDIEFFERTETETFLLTYKSGDTLTRAGAIEALRSSGTGITYTNDDLNIQLHGDVAIVTGRMIAKHGNDKEGGYTSEWRWVDLLKNNNGRWQILSTTQIDN